MPLFLFLYFVFVIFELFLSDFCQWTRRHRIFKRIPVGIALKSSWLHLMSFLVVRFSLHIPNGCTMMWRNLRDMHNNISSVVEFQRWWVLKSKIFSQESTYSREIFFKKSVDEFWFIKKCQNCTFKVNFQCQKSTEFSQKKLRLRPNILAKRLGGRSLSRLMKNFGLGLLTD